MTSAPRTAAGADDGRSFDPSLFEIFTIAEHYYREGRNYAEIAALMGISPATVSRRLTDAKERKLVREQAEILMPEQYRGPVTERVICSTVADRLTEELNKRGAGLRRVVAVLGTPDPVKEPKETESEEKARRHRIAQHTARLVSTHLQHLCKELEREETAHEKQKENSVAGEAPAAGPGARQILCGVNWGYWVREMCMCFAELCEPSLAQSKRVSFSGISGPFWVKAEQHEFWNQAATATAADNAEIAASAFSDREKVLVHRVHIPVYLEQAMRKLANPNANISAFCNMDPGYRFLFGERPILPSETDVNRWMNDRRAYLAGTSEQFGHIAEHDLIVSSFSSLTEKTSLVRYGGDELRENLSYLKEEEDICGDLASHLFRSDGHVPRGESTRAGDLNQRALTIWPEDFQEIAKRTRMSGKEHGGVVLFSAGRDRANALKVILTELQAANEIVIDSNLAYEMYTLIGISDRERDHDFRLGEFSGRD